MVLSASELGEFFATFRASAFRLEQHGNYSEEDEADYFASWRRRDPMPADWRTNPWVAGIVADGRALTRVRVLDTPRTEYERFQLEWAYVGNARSGEDIRLLERVDAQSLPNYDFWLFDDTTAVRLIYAANGSFIGAEPTIDTAPYRAYRETALARAIPYQ